MATKAELEAELEALRREVKQYAKESKSRNSDVIPAKSADEPNDTDALKELLDEHGINAESIDAFKGSFLKELTDLQKKNPLVVLVAACALGIIVGRALK